MPRNDQVTRQWHILRLLEVSHAGLTLQALVEALPNDFPNHPRTIRRDLEALEVAGFPIDSDRIGGHVRWRLMDGFRNVPALAFSPTELMALVMSRALLKPLEGTQVQTALDSALSKASKVLPSSSANYVRHVQGIFSVGLGPHKGRADEDDPHGGGHARIGGLGAELRQRCQDHRAKESSSGGHR
jgi:predicted DNA-binding transcriptional regulator YafY